MTNSVSLIENDELRPNLTELTDDDKVRYFDLLMKVRDEVSIFPRFVTIVKMLMERAVYLYILQTSENVLLQNLSDKEYRSTLNQWIKVLNALVAQCKLDDEKWMARENFLQELMKIVKEEVPTEVVCECGKVMKFNALARIRDRLFNLQ